MKRFSIRHITAWLLAAVLITTSLCGCAKNSGVYTENAQTPAPFIALDGAVNVRDIGGYPIAGGGLVKHGMVYRGSEIDGVCSPYVLTENGRAYARNSLHLRSDFDLRGDTIKPLSKSIFGDDVRYYCFNIRAYNNIFSSKYMESIAAVFAELADEENYPLYLHCTYGMDRTGTVCYVLEALLGMSASDIDSEYRLSFVTFPDNAEVTEDYDSFVQYFNALDGDSYREKAWNYLLACGVSERELTAIIELLTE